MKIKKFKDLNEAEMEFIINIHYNHWVKYNPKMKIEDLKKYPDIYPWLSDVMIIEKYRGQGYGKKLISIGEKTLKELGYKTIYVWTDQAPDFYKKLGFKYKQKVEKNEGGFGELFYKEIE